MSMIDIECPKPAYDRLVNAGIDKKILERKNIIESILLNNNIYTEGYDYHKNKSFEGDGSKLLKNIKNLQNIIENPIKQKLFSDVLKIE